MKARSDYFSMLENQSEYCVKAAVLLKEHLFDFKPELTRERRSAMHALEHEADMVKHDLLTKLSREFITPIERDDIFQLSSIIDDVTDAIDDVSIKIYMFNITALTKEVRQLAEVVVRCTEKLHAAVSELRNFKKSDKLQKLVIELNNLEAEADGIYIEAVHSLFAAAQPSVAAVSIREVYECLEGCCDLCEHVADIIENTIMRNN